ncbi:tRNA (adenosine(37)-N6)-threonylcarbamoyltransferase complex ATPase subunit type 1 TsaE [Philodulcilactobacillus myokoensis]|uniref:tRNA threonylcarbamoyladenosine biosynthesis protein TsaE n=1 Tax=Philodulcilactobacillus myokoensis TaxID=2929573 RepID=A0A9W6B197_9LACO|nr:tRNA (adenosine(37)-N6)-threonylcarbamoyltransferase complex ATPase subunit type 1 TsaE [Philodulcilactobacillus myokoensis]GLB47119.1 tRNA (adenosine(37)-N6)-threonylcarbamoyltransferase complex ATPase subunit type 1 TsaE [Philodulcilactobacillus myokoensis]
MKLEVNNSKETIGIGKSIAKYLKPGDVIVLDGDLGAGKTTFTKGIAKGLGIKRYVVSPTFTIIKEYKDGRIPLYHMDAYRLDDGSGADLGLDEYFDGDGVSVVEWSRYVKSELPAQHLQIIFKRDDLKGENYRTLEFNPVGDHFKKMISESLNQK